MMINKPTEERTDEELQLAYELYVQSKTLNGRFCPTPELHTSHEYIACPDDGLTPAEAATKIQLAQRRRHTLRV